MILAAAGLVPFFNAQKNIPLASRSDASSLSPTTTLPAVYGTAAPPEILLETPSTPVLAPPPPRPTTHRTQVAFAAPPPSSPSPVRSSPSPAPQEQQAIPSFDPLPPPAPNQPAPSIIPDPGNQIQNPSVEDIGPGSTPTGWLQTSEGVNTPTFTYPAPGHNGGSAVEVSISSYTSGEADWYFQNVPATGNEAFSFFDYYTATVPTYVVVQFNSATGGETWVRIARPSPAATWTKAEGTFVTPPDTTSVTVFHLIKGVGTLTTDDYSLTQIPAAFSHGMVSLNFDDGWRSAYEIGFPILHAARIPATFYIVSTYLGYPHYMTKQDVLTLEAAGNEIGAHTRTHPDVTTLSPQAMQNEIAGSRMDLLGMGVHSVTTFAYPYGTYNGDADVIVRQSGYLGARTTDDGMDFPGSNPYLLKSETVDANTTVAQIEDWINQAIQSDQWLTLVFHQLDQSFVGAGDAYSMSSSNFQAVVNYLVQNNVPVVTTAQGIQDLGE